MLKPRITSEAYYIDQGIVEPEEWGAFIQTLRDPLPTSFRITSGKSTTSVLLRQMHETYLPFLTGVQYEGETIPAPKVLPWYPEGLGWQIDVRKNVLRKTEQFKKFQHFLVHETEVGNISRQETVSMIPPLFLDVQQHHIVLDMCAAPGSKTAQLIEALHSPLTTSPESFDPCPPGFVVANDSDAKRAHMLVHQSSRLPSPNLCVANCDASNWPSVKVPWKSEAAEAAVEERTMRYDRILADVPCSGDGTLRKNLLIWKEWHPNTASNLHNLQLRILMRGLHSLRPGGRLVYSTCSLNPIENEAVVAAALRECAGSVHIVDQSDVMPDLKRRRGLATWKVCPGKGKHLFEGGRFVDASSSSSKGKKVEVEGAENGEAAAEEEEAAAPEPGSAAYRATLPQVPYVSSWQRLQELDPSLAERTSKTMWPQGDEEELGIRHCMRIVPQDQNTGGFFVTVLEKKASGDAEENEGMAVGMLRALDMLDAEREAQEAQEAESTAKRPLSPDGEAEEDEAPAKKVKQDGETAEVETEAQAEEMGQEDEAEEKPEGEHSENEVPDGPDTNVKPDNHAVDRQKARLGNHDNGVNSGGMPYREDPLVHVSQRNPQVHSIVDFFHFTDKFNPRNLLVRNKDGQPLRSVYLTSNSIRALISGGGPGKGAHPTANPIKMRLINAGTKAFGRQEGGRDPKLQCKWRILSDAILALRPLMAPSNILKAQMSDLAYLATHHYPTLESLPEEDDKPDSFFSLVKKDLRMGSHLVDVMPGTWTSPFDGETKTLDSLVTVPIWRAAASVNLMLDKQEKSALSFRVFGADLSNPTGDRQFAVNKNQQAQMKASAEKRAQREKEQQLVLDEEELQRLENEG